MSREQRNLSEVLSRLAIDLHANKVSEIFGVVGDPITPLVGFAENLGIRYYGFRNEQSASFAASAVSFLRGVGIGVVMTVAGPGFTNAITGLANARMNGWPMLLVCPLVEEIGAFQSLSCQRKCLEGIAEYFIYDGVAKCEEAIKLAYSVRGPVVMFVVHTSEAIVCEQASLKNSVTHLHKSTFLDHKFAVRQMYEKWTSPVRALLIIGAGAGMHGDVGRVHVPFICDPMGRGLIPESDPMCMSAARSLAMKSCTVAIFVCASLDWMYVGKFANNCQFLFVKDFRDLSKLQVDSDWVKMLQKKVSENKSMLVQKEQTLVPSALTHLHAIQVIKDVLSKRELNDCLVISEGANTMDVVRVGLDNIRYPRKRLDAGKWGCMGGALGYTVAANSVCESSLTITIVGDSALGFSGMELETLVRYKCKCLIIVFNNGGIYTGAPDNATAFTPHIRHDMLIKAFGGFGYRANSTNIFQVLNTAISNINDNQAFPALVDIEIDPNSGNISGSLSRL